MKKVLVSIFAIISLMAFAGCAEEQAQNPMGNEDTTTPQEDRVEVETPDDTEIDQGEIEEEVPEEPELPEDEIEEPQPEDEEMPEEPQPEDVDIEEEILDGGEYIGSWSRVSATLDGASIGGAAATITMTKDSYVSSTAYCSVTGDLIVTDDVMDVFVTSNGCPGDAPTDYVFTYKITDDGKTMTLINTQFGGTMVEVYSFAGELEEDED